MMLLASAGHRRRRCPTVTTSALLLLAVLVLEVAGQQKSDHYKVRSWSYTLYKSASGMLAGNGTKAHMTMVCLVGAGR